MNKQQRELQAVYTEMKNAQVKLEDLLQTMKNLMSVDLTILNQKGMQEHHAKVMRINLEIQTFMEEYKRLKTELDNTLEK